MNKNPKLLLGLLFASLVVSAQSFPESFDLNPPDGSANDYYGRVVASHRDHAVFGAKGDDDRGSGSGSVYVFRKRPWDWVFSQKLTASNGNASDAFGEAVAIYGSTLAVCAPNTDDLYRNSGTVYLFELGENGWEEQAQIKSPDAAEGQRFGTQVALYENQMVITRVGAAYVFEKNSNGNWNYKTNLNLPASGSIGKGPVALTAGRLIIGDYQYAEGRAHIYTGHGATWSLETTLAPASLQTDDYFGFRVDIDGDMAVVGAWGSDINGFAAGAAYFFRFDGTQWVEMNVFSENLRFSTGVSLDGQLAVVANEGSAFEAPKAVVYETDCQSWYEIARIDMPAASGRQAVSLSGMTFVSGGHIGVGDNGQASGVGVAHDLTWHLAEVPRVNAQNERIHTLPGNGASTGDGQFLAADESKIYMGFPGNNNQMGNAAGAIKVIDNNPNATVVRDVIYPPSAGDSQVFGRNIAEAGDYLMVSVHGNAPNPGAIYFYNKNNLSAPAFTFSNFGANVQIRGPIAMTENFAVASAYHNAVTEGPMVTFRKSGGVWYLDNTFYGPQSGQVNLGAALDLVETGGNVWIAVAASWTEPHGEVYMYKRNSAYPGKRGYWSKKATLVGGDTANYGYGTRLDLDGDTLVVTDMLRGGPYEGLYGAAYVYKRQNDDWRLVQSILGRDVQGESGLYLDYFGMQVRLSGQDLYVAAGTDEANLFHFVESCNGFVLADVLHAGTWFNTFGGDVEVTNSWVLIPGETPFDPATQNFLSQINLFFHPAP